MATRPDVPFEKVQRLAVSYRELDTLRKGQAATMAELIRGCVAALRQTTDEARRKLERERRHLTGFASQVRLHEPTKKVNDDKRLAFLHLEWLATQLENQSVRSPDTIDQGELPCTAE